MKVGVTFPQTEIGPDPGGVRAYAEAARDLGYTHILAFDHAIGADTSVRPGWQGPYSLESQFHEVFVLFGHLAALVPELELVTGVLILPQRQTVLVAKQAAEVDVLTHGRFRLGIGVGWNDVEYQALGENFSNRGRRSEEQIALLKELFTRESVTFDGRWHHVEAAGINPMPVQRPIPIWIGGAADATLRRVAAMGDGWFPQLPVEQAPEVLDRLRGYVHEAGRDQDEVGIEPRLNMSRVPRDRWGDVLEAWRSLGASHISINTMGIGLRSPQDHIDAIRRFKEEFV
jgi:probable F420-dependent oxidoreductase